MNGYGPRDDHLQHAEECRDIYSRTIVTGTRRGAAWLAVIALLTGLLTTTVATPALAAPPTFTSPMTVSTAENQTAATTLTATDPDFDTVTFSVTGGADAAAFTTTGVNGEDLAFVTAPDFEAPTDLGGVAGDNDYVVEVSADDGNSPLVLQTITVTVTDLNDNAPVPNASLGFAVAEDAGDGTSVGTVTISDADSAVVVTGFAIDPGSDPGGTFSISSGGAITLNVPPGLDFETRPAFMLSITATDGVNPDAAAEDVSVTVLDVNEPPQVDSAAFTVSEAAGGGTVVGTVTATDPDAGDSIAAFAIVAGDPKGAFAVTVGGVLKVADPLLLASGAPYSLMVRAYDTGGLSDDATVTVSLTPNQPPVIVDPGRDRHPKEGERLDIDPVEFSDPDLGDTHTATIDWGDGTAERAIVDAAASTVSAAHVYADSGDYTVTVTVHDAAGATAQAVITVTVRNVKPTVAALSDRHVIEGALVSLPVIPFTDPGTLDTHPLASVNWRDGSDVDPVTVLEAPFGPPGSIHGLTGYLLVPGHVYTDDGSPVARVCISDDDGLQGCSPITINVANADPVVAAPPAASGDEGSILTLEAAFVTDPGTADTHTATVDWGDGSAVEGVVVDPATGEISVGSHLYADNGAFSVTICAEDDDGGVGCGETEVVVANVEPTFTALRITDLDGNDTIRFDQGNYAVFLGQFTDPGADAHTVTVDWGDGEQTVKNLPAGVLAFEARHKYATVPEGSDYFVAQITVTDDDGGAAAVAGPIFVNQTKAVTVPDTVGLFDPAGAKWHLRDQDGSVTSFTFGAAGDVPIAGDWDCDGIDTPGLYRPSSSTVLLINRNATGSPDHQFLLGQQGDVPLAGDFNGDGCDTVSVYRPGNQRIYVFNELGSAADPLGAAAEDYGFGNPGANPFSADFDGNGVDEVGLHRESTGLVYYRLTHTTGIADDEFIYGNPNDRLVGGDWTGFGFDTPALFRPANTTFFFRFSNTAGNADEQLVFGEPTFLPVAGVFGLGATSQKRQLPAASPLWPLQTRP